MADFSLAATAGKKKTHDLSSHLLSDFTLFCSFIFFIFVSPYFFKFFSFLSPLFLTTTLLILAFFTLAPSFVVNQSTCPWHLEFPESKVITFLLTTYQTLVETILRSKFDVESDGLGCLEEFEAYKIVFETSTILEIRENPDEVWEMEAKEDCLQAVEAPFDKGLGVPETLTSASLDEKPAQITRPERHQVKAVVEIFENFLQEKDRVEIFSWKRRDKQVKSLSVESDKVEEQKEKGLISSGSKAMGDKISDPKVAISADNGGEQATKAMVNSPRVKANWSTENGGGDYNYSSQVADKYQTMGSNLGNSGSIRKEKEWKRTLACKLFEERHSNNGGEGMDLLWETYENETESINKVQIKSRSRKVKKGGNEYYDIDEDRNYEEGSGGQLCCIQALKFSAGKMNLGMGRPNLVKISKALKGIGWLYHVSSRHGKKVYH